MSSHREAPGISKDPVADSTDVYAFVSPDKPDTVTLIANYVPLQGPAGGPNFYEFGDDVLYEIHIDNNGDGRRRRDLPVPVHHHGGRPGHVPLQHRPDRVARQPELEPPPVLHRHPVAPRAQPAELATNLACPPCNIGPLSTPDYPALAAQAVHSLPGGGKVFAGQRAEGFYVDLGSIFDLGDLRPFASDHTTSACQVPDQRPRRERDQEPQRPLHRDPGADHRPDRRAVTSPRAHRPEGGDRRLDHRQPPAGPGLRRRPQPCT